MDALPDSIRGQPNFGCADTWIGCEELFALVQGADWKWRIYVPSPNRGPVERRGPIFASNVALDMAIDLWQDLNGRKIPGELEFFKIEHSERMGL